MPALRPADLELLSAYLDNELTLDERALLEQRLASDESLRQELAALRQVSLAVRGMPALRAPRDFRLDPAVYSRRPQRQWFRLYQWSSALSAAAALIVFVIGVFGVLNQNTLVQTDNVAFQAAGSVTETEDRAVAVLPTESMQLTQPTMSSTPLTLVPPVMGRAVDGQVAEEAAEAPAAAASEMQVTTSPSREAVEVGGEGAPVTAVPLEVSAVAVTVNALEAAQAAPPAASMADNGAAPFGTGGGLSATELPSEMFDAMPEAAALPAQASTGADEGNAEMLDGLRDGAFEEPTREDDSWKTVPGIVAQATGTPAPLVEFFAQEQEAPADTPAAVKSYAIDPGMLIGASIVLLAFAAMLFAFSRRMRR